MSSTTKFRFKNMALQRHCERLKGARQSSLWIASSLLLLAMTILIPISALAQEPDPATLENRLALARQMQEFRPVKEQVDTAIEMYIAQIPEAQRETYKAAIRDALNYQALEKLSVDAMAETYTEAELRALVEHYSKPEARSASDKYETYAGKVYPEITRMLDKAMMRLKMGADNNPSP